MLSVQIVAFTHYCPVLRALCTPDPSGITEEVYHTVTASILWWQCNQCPWILPRTQPIYCQCCMRRIGSLLNPSLGLILSFEYRDRVLSTPSDSPRIPLCRLPTAVLASTSYGPLNSAEPWWSCASVTDLCNIGKLHPSVSEAMEASAARSTKYICSA